MLMLGYPSANLTVFVAGDPVVIERCSRSTVWFGGYCQKVISLGKGCAKANTLTIVMIVLLELMLKEYANRIHTRDFGNVGLDFLSAFNDVRLILQNSSDVHVPLP
jgi:hypothetical protein